MRRIVSLLCCFFCLAFSQSLAAAGLSAIWLSSKSHGNESEQFRQAWQQQRGQALELKALTPSENLVIPAATWFVISADDGADQALQRSVYRGPVISLRAERARAALDLQSARWAGIYADPDEAQFSQFARAVHRDFRQLGVVFDRRSVVHKSEWLRATQTQQQQLQGLYLQEGEYVERVLATLLNRADVLMVSANSDIYANVSLDNVVLQALKHGKIVIAGGDDAVHSGALFTLVPAPKVRLQQALQITLSVLRGERARFHTAERFHLLINQQVLRSLNVNIDRDQLLRDVTFPLTLPQDDNA